MNNEPIILHISTPSSWRGGEQQLFYLFDTLHKKGVKQFLLCRKGGALAKKAKALNWNVIEQPKRTAIDPFFAAKIAAVCKRNKINVMHTHDAHAHTFATLSAVLFANKTPLVVSRRVDFPIKPTWFSKFKYNHKNIVKILCVSDAIKAITAPDIINKNVLETVHSGIDLSKFTFDKNDCKTLRATYNIDPLFKLVGNVAAIAPHKDYNTFVDTVAILVNRDVKAKFFIIGNGPDEAEIKAYVAEKRLNDWIIFAGFRSDIPQVLPELDVFLITSETEGLGTSVLDAFACKLPVVATKAGGIPELVQHKKTGWLADVKNAQELANGVEAFLNNSLDIALINKNQAQLLQSFSKTATAEKTLAVYQSL